MSDAGSPQGLVYCDTSALVKLTRQEAESAELAAFLRGRLPIASVLAQVEVLRAVTRSSASAALLLAARRLLASVLLIPLSPELVEHAGTLTPASLRTLDAIHLAAALSVVNSLEAFVAYDLRLGAAARDCGLFVVAPGAP